MSEGPEIVLCWHGFRFGLGYVRCPAGCTDEKSERRGRPLGAASGGDPGFWDRLGYGDGMMPAHLPMGVLRGGEGPVGDDIAHHYVCWCGDTECPLTLALGHAWKSGRRSTPSEGQR